MVQPRSCVVGIVVVLAIYLQMALCSPSPAEQQGAPPIGQTSEQVKDLSPGEGDAEGGVDAEGRSCGTCGLTAHPAPTYTHDLGNLGGNFELPDIFGKLQDVKLLTLIGLAIPILVLQIITLSIVAYLLKMVKNEDDTGTGSGTGGLYAAYPVQAGGGGYMDSYSSYRSLVPSEDTMSWVLERLSAAVDLYHDYQDHQNAI